MLGGVKKPRLFLSLQGGLRMSTTVVIDDATTITRELDAPAQPQPTAPRRPLALSDAQLEVVQRGAQPVHPHDRAGYLQAVANLLADCEIGDGAVARAAAEAQRRFRIPPDLSRGAGVTRYERRGAGR